MQHLNRRHEVGFTLLESLVAMLILSIAALGLLSLTVKAMQQSVDSYQRSIAVSQADSLIEELWAGLCTLPDNGFATIEAQWREQMRSALTGEPVLPNWGAEALSPSLLDDGALYRVPVTVYWGPTAQRPRHRVTLIALLPRQECS